MPQPMPESTQQRIALAHAVVITGGIACGKSSVCRMLQRQGFSVVCADTIAHAVLEECVDELVRAFGEGILAGRAGGVLDSGAASHYASGGSSGKINRRALGEIVFGSVDKRRLLESITHPRIHSEIMRQAQALESSLARKGLALDSMGESGGLHGSLGWYFLDIPLFFESGARYEVGHVVCVSAPEGVQIARLQARNALSHEQARTRIAAQMPLTEKCRRSTYVIDNSGTIEELAQRVQAMLKSLESRA